MRIVGVIDVRDRRSVHAVAGRRAAYAPIATVADIRVDGDPEALARVYVAELGVRELYVADLDAIERGMQAANRDAVRAVTAVGVPVWLDAGVTSVADARVARDNGASVVIAGLETLSSFGALGELGSALGAARLAFSIDLRGGHPITVPNAAHAGWSAEHIAERAAAAGAGTIIVLDVARVGTAAGVDVALMREIRRAAPDVALFAGGGIRGEADVDALRAVGCDGALVATALMSGAVSAGGNQSRTRKVAD